jgi:hypothetical protein
MTAIIQDLPHKGAFLGEELESLGDLLEGWSRFEALEPPIANAWFSIRCISILATVEP